MANGTSATKVITGKIRLSYANIWQPKSINGGQPKYSCSILIPKSDTKTLGKINSAVEAAIKEGTAKFGGKTPNPATLKLPLRDGDIEREGDPAYKDHFFVNATSNDKPQVVDKDRNCITEEQKDEVYSGVYARASINFYAFNSNGNKGIACGLNNIQKLADGERLGGRASAEDDFATDYDDDFLS